MPLLTSHSPLTTATAVAAAAVLSSRRKVTPFSIENLLNSREQQERERIIEMSIKEEEEEGDETRDLVGEVHEDRSGIPNDNGDSKEDENRNNKSWHQQEETNAAVGAAESSPSEKPLRMQEIPRPTPLSVVVSPPSASAAMNYLAVAGASGGGGPSSALAVAMAHHISNLLPSSSPSLAYNQSTPPVPSPSPSPAAAVDKSKVD